MKALILLGHFKGCYQKGGRRSAFILECMRKLRGKACVPKAHLTEHQMVPLTKIDVDNKKVTEQEE